VNCRCPDLAWRDNGAYDGTMTEYAFDRFIVELSASRLREAIGTLIEELDALPARELVLDLQRVPDELLVHAVAVIRFLGVKRRVKIAGARARQVRELTWLGIEPDAILIGSWPTPRTGAPPD
jgi:hypothetical protein